MKPAISESVRQRHPATCAPPQRELLTQSATLTNGSYSVRLRGDGGGYATFESAAVTRLPSDPSADPAGFYLYIRDVDEELVWSAGYRPTRVTPSEYAFRCDGRMSEIVRVDHGIECRLAVCISPEHNLEIRLCRLKNLGTYRRRLEVTSYLEWVLGNPDADASHPAFAKLFVQTDYCPDRSAILAQRRPRSCGEAPLWGFHAVARDLAANFDKSVNFETNRARFIGRGRTLECPRALVPGECLSGDFGSVLDPIASLRIAVEIEPGEVQDAAFVLGAATNKGEIEQLLESARDFHEMRKQVDAASATELGDTPSSLAAWSSGGSSNGDRFQVHPPHGTRSRSAIESTSNKQFTPDTLADIGDQKRFAETAGVLEFDNGYGGFSKDGREYVIRVSSDGCGGQRRPPMPWVNVIANEKAGFLVTESGAGYTWCGNSRLNRLTTWHNDPVIDPHSEATWIRDEEAGVFWSPMPGPTPSPNDYLVRHGLGYTTFEHQSRGLSQETTMFVSRDAPVKVTRCRITNLGDQSRRLSLFHYLRWALGGLASETTGQVTTQLDAKNRIIWAMNPNRLHYEACSSFSTIVVDPADAAWDVAGTCDSESFIGSDGCIQRPKALINGDSFQNSAVEPQQPCAAWQVSIELPPYATFEASFLLGEAADRDQAHQIIRDHGSKQQIQQSSDDVIEFWNDLTSAIVVETPDREIDLMVNGWLLYQNLSCRMWGRSAYYQPGGAFGFRDQLQDSAAFIQHQPSITRRQILRHAAQQFADGDVLHWWHPDTGYGVRTRFSDDLLWLPYVTAEYVHKTGDQAILDEEAPFIASPSLAAGQQESYLRPSVSAESASLYEHCCRALDRGLTTGANGLPLIGCGDWNDGFSRVGGQGRGESVWLGFFIEHILEQMLPICQQRADNASVTKYAAYRKRLREALNSTGWDGQWYRRAYYDNGAPLGSSTSDECQIDAIAQAWAVMSRVAPPERAQMAMDAVEQRLIDDETGMIRLLTPPFDSTPHDPGYIKGYLPGIRENGGQYTHGVLWVVRAMAEMGRGTRAVQLLRMLTPVWHASSCTGADVYKTEPYVVAADVYGEPPHVGRGGWTWYTGSAGWMYRVAVESIFGLTTEHGRTLVINPAISSAWPHCRITYRLPDDQTRYEITIENPSGKEHGVTAALLDEAPVPVENGAARIPLLRDATLHRVNIRL